jgi:hypothetical protein
MIVKRLSPSIRPAHRKSLSEGAVGVDQSEQLFDLGDDDEAIEQQPMPRDASAPVLFRVIFRPWGRIFAEAATLWMDMSVVLGCLAMKPDKARRRALVTFEKGEMMRGTLLCLVLIACAIACSTAAGSSIANSKPRKLLQETEVLEVVPGSFEQLWRDSAVVLRARVVSAVARAVPNPLSPNSVPTVETEARLQVLAVYKGNPAADKTGRLNVFQLGGTVEEPTRTLRVADVEPLHPSAEYLIFLGWNGDSKQWVVRGREGVFEIRDERLHPYGHSGAALQREGSRFSNVVDEMRRLGLRDEVHR